MSRADRKKDQRTLIHPPNNHPSPSNQAYNAPNKAIVPAVLNTIESGRVPYPPASQIFCKRLFQSGLIDLSYNSYMCVCQIFILVLTDRVKVFFQHAKLRCLFFCRKRPACKSVLVIIIIGSASIIRSCEDR